MKYNGYSYSYRLLISNPQITPRLKCSTIITCINSVDLFINVVVVQFFDSIGYANLVNKDYDHGE